MTTKELQTARIEDLKTRYNAEVEEYKDIIIVTYSKEINNTIRPLAQIFKAKAGRPYSHYYYFTEEQRDHAIAQAKEGADSRQSYKDEKKQAKANFVPEAPVGTIFHHSWGYDQTNNDFYEVVERPSTHFAILREIAQEHVRATGPMSDEVKPVPGKFVGEPFRAKLLPSTYKGVSIKIRDWDWAYKLEDVNAAHYNSWYH